MSGFHDNPSFHSRSQGEDMSSTVAADAQQMVFEASRPVEPGEGVKAQIRRAWVSLGRPEFWRVRAAWYGEAGCWSAAAFEDLKQRYAGWREQQEARGRAHAELAVQRLVALRRSLAASGEDLGGERLVQLDAVLRDLGAEVGAVAD